MHVQNDLFERTGDSRYTQTALPFDRIPVRSQTPCPTCGRALLVTDTGLACDRCRGPIHPPEQRQ